ncbi:MAG TPA: hypothetical protein PLE77_07480 [Kiritimatiellia bacterium]|nr:hypothetical protein [Kiritimatiellia bacterium]
MTIRVNLLQPHEYRRQGAVSGTFILRVSIGTALAFLTLFSVLGFVWYEIAQRDLAAAREIWRIREPMYNQIMAMKQDLAVEKKLQQELDGWKTWRLAWTPLLLEFQKIVPPTMQIKRLNMRGDMELARKGGATSSGEMDTAAAAKVTFIPTIKYNMIFDGKASGAEAETTVVQFVRTIGRAAGYESILDPASVKLRSMQRDTSEAGEQPDRVFSIEATTMARSLK